jgi:hypothetical protein
MARSGARQGAGYHGVLLERLVRQQLDELKCRTENTKAQCACVQDGVVSTVILVAVTALATSQGDLAPPLGNASDVPNRRARAPLKFWNLLLSRRSVTFAGPLVLESGTYSGAGMCMGQTSRGFACFVLVTAASLAGCAGKIEDPLHGSGSGAPAAGSGKAASTFAPAPASLRKLTVEQYRNSVSDLLGSGVTLPTDLEPDTAQNGFYAIGAAKATISPAAVEKFEQAAYALASQALAPDKRARIVSCTPSGAVDSTCSRTFVKQFGRRAFRRPVSDAEIARYAKLADDSAAALKDFHAGLEFALAGMLQSPNFLFRAELGEPDPSSSARKRYGDYELAARMSYALWNTTPDDALLTAADGGALTGAGLPAAVDRLLADPRALSALDDFHSERLGLADLASLDKDSSVYSGGMTDELRDALKSDVLRTFAELAHGDFLDVFDTRIAFVNSALAGIYGLSTKPTAVQRVELPSDGKRAGLLGKPAFLALAAHANETSPTLRGKFLRERVLCESIGAPPPNVVPVLGKPDPNAPTMRERLQAHASDASCAGCHNQMDPLGLALEHFDAIGRYRADDHGHALDVSGNLDGDAFDGAVELAQLLRDDARSAQCLVRQTYRYMLGHVESSGEEPQIASLVAQFDGSSHELTGLLRALVMCDAFRYTAKDLAP